MSFLKISSVRIDGMAACVPSQKSDYTRYQHLFTPQQYEMFENKIGISSVRIADERCTSSDLCFNAAQKLLKEMSINSDEIDLLVFVSQSPDYPSPMTSCLLQHRLGLSKECITFDIPSGCSGYVLGLSVVSSMLSSGGLRRALLLSGDTTYNISPNDKTTYPLFGSAGSATLLSYDFTVSDMCFEIGTDGGGSEAIIVREGGARNPYRQSSLQLQKIACGVERCGIQMELSGQDVFSFAISEIPDSIERLYSKVVHKIDDTNYFVFHQANKMILETIADILEIPLEKIPMSLKEYGNTSSASIPLTIISQIGSIYHPTQLFLCSFGAGLSWGSVIMSVDKIYCSPLLEV